MLKKEDYTSRLGKRLYEIVFNNQKDKDALKDAVIEPLPKTEYVSKKAGKKVRAYSALQQVPAEKVTNKAGELSDIVQEAQEMQQPEQQKPYEQPKADYAEPKQDPNSPTAKPEEQKEYKHVTRRQALKMCEQRGVIGEKVELLKLLSNISIKKSTLIEGASNAGKSWLMDHVFELVPENLKCLTNDNKNFLELAKRYKGQFPFIVIGELQTFLRGSVNEKDILRCIGNGEIYNYPLDDGTNLPISAAGVFACIADSNRYKKMIVEGDKELLRRFHRVYVTLTDEKMNRRLEAMAKQQMPSYDEIKEQEADLKDIQNHIERTIMLEIPQKRFFNPFARFLIEYISESCKGSGNMEDAAKIATYHKNYVLAGVKWNARHRKFGKQDDTRYIAGIGDIYTAKQLTDSDLKGSGKEFDWHACWESGIESLKASGYPESMIRAYQRRQTGEDNKIYLTNLLEDTVVELIDLNKPKPTNIIVTTEKYEPFGNKTESKSKPGTQPSQEIYEPEEVILDAEYQILESGDEEQIKALTIRGRHLLPPPADSTQNSNPGTVPEKANLPAPYVSNPPSASKKGLEDSCAGLLPGPSECDEDEIDPELKALLPVPYGQKYPAGKKEPTENNRNNGLPFTERKYITCKKNEE